MMALLITAAIINPVWCLAIGLLIYARRHYAIHKAMHARVLALVADYPSDGNQSGYDNSDPKNGHGAPRLMP